ncbi:MAG: mechanosensitive ion channel family protein [bacterium]
MKEETLSYTDQLYNWGMAHGPRIVAILIITVILFFLLRLALRSFLKFYLRKEEEGSEKEKRARTLRRVLSALGSVLIILSGAMMLLSEFGLDMKPVLASLGIGGLAIGFGAQSLVKDVIGGFFMLLEDQVRENDVVEAGGRTGLVESVGLRTLVMRDLSGNRIIIPNGEVSSVVNMTYEFSRIVLDIGVAYKEDVERVTEVIRAVGQEMIEDPQFKNIITEPLEILGLDKFDDSAVIIKARFTTTPLQQWAVKREFNKRLKKAFDQQGIEIPFPHRTLYFGQENEQVQKHLEKEIPKGEV